MTSPYTVVGGAARTERDHPLSLDAAAEQRIYRDAQEIEKASTDLEKQLEDPSKVHFWHGQQHAEHKFSLMDPVHPATPHDDEPALTEHFAPASQTQHKVGDTQPLPMFDPAQAPQ